MSEGEPGAAAGSLHVAVVGGGISGLSTAWYIQEQAAALGLPVECSVFDSADRWGGRILTDIVDREEGRFVVEGGPDSFLAAQKPWAVDLALELGLAERLLGTNDAARKVYVLSKGRPVPLPEGVFLLLPTRFKPFLLSPLISPWGKLRMGLEVFIPPRKGTADETLGDFVTRRLGSEALDKIAEPLLSGIYNAEAQRQSLLATFPRFRETELRYGSLVRGMLEARAEARGQRQDRRRQVVQTAPLTAQTAPVTAQPGGATLPGGATQPGGTTQPDATARLGTVSPPGAAGDARPSSMFVSFLAGTEEIVTGLTRGLHATLLLGATVQSLQSDPQGGFLLEISGESRPATQAMAVRERVRADAVILAIPAYDAARLLTSVSPEAAGILDSIRYVSTGTLSLAFRRNASSERLGGFGVLVPRSERRPLNAVTWSSTKFDHRAPEGHSLLRVFFGGSRSPGSMQLDNDELLRVVRKELRSIMGITDEPLFHRVYRWENANAQYDVEHLRRVEEIERALPPGVWVTGSPYRGVGLPDCVHQSRITATQVMKRLSEL